MRKRIIFGNIYNESIRYLDFADAYHQIGRFLEDVYMHKRIHSSLGYLTPVEFENQWSALQTAGTRIDQERLSVCPVFWAQFSHLRLTAKGA